MTSKHTKGPWKLTWMPYGGTAEIETVSTGDDYRHMTNQLPMAPSEASEFEIVEYGTERWRRYSAEACANARLMAASPVMYDALKKFTQLTDRLKAGMDEGGSLPAQVFSELFHHACGTAELLYGFDHPKPVVLTMEES